MSKRLLRSVLSPKYYSVCPAIGTNFTWNLTNTQNWMQLFGTPFFSNNGTTYGQFITYPVSKGNTLVMLTNGNSTYTIQASTNITFNQLFSVSSATIATNTSSSITVDGGSPKFWSLSGATTAINVPITCLNPLLITGPSGATWTLNASNIFANGIQNTGGILQTNNSNGFGNGTIIVGPSAGSTAFRLTASSINCPCNFILNSSVLGVASRAQLEATGNSVNATFSGVITIGSGFNISNGGIFGASGTSAILNITGPINGTIGTLGGGFFQRLGIVIYSGGGSLTGSMTLDNTAGCTARIGATNGMPTGGSLAFGGTSNILDLNGFSQSFSGLSGAGIISNGSTTANGTFLLTGSLSNTYPGVVSDVTGTGTKTTSFIYNSSGTGTFSGIWTNTGGLTISSGTFKLMGTTSCSIAVNNGILLGTGTSSGSITVANTTGAILAGGTGTGNAGTLTCGVLTFNGASSAINVYGTGAAVSVIASTGAVTLSGVIVNIINATNAGTYNIITSTISMSGTATIGTNNSGRTVTSLSISGNNLQLILT